MDLNDFQLSRGFDKDMVCEFFDRFGRFYLNEAIKDEKDAINFYGRISERMTNILDDNDKKNIESIIQDEIQHEELFSDIYEKIHKSCSGSR